MTAPQPGVVASAQRAAEHLANGEWQDALVEYGIIVIADPMDNAANIGIARALARGGYLGESCLVIDKMLRRHPYDEGTRRNLQGMVRAEAGPVAPQAPIGNVAAHAGLLTWRHSQWLSAYLVLMMAISVLPLIVGLTQGHYLSILFGALAGGTLIYLYIARHRVPIWRL